MLGRLALLLACGALVSLALGCSSGSSSPNLTRTPVPTTAAPATLAAAAGATAEQPLPSQSFSMSLPVGYRIESLLDGLQQPTSIATLPDGRLLITEQVAGRVRVVQDGRLLPDPWFELPVFVQTESFAVQELGLVTIAVDPRFEENKFVYIYYTEQRTGGTGRTIFARLREINGKGTDLTPLVTIEQSPQKSHIAGGIAFQGEAILLGVGDHEQAGFAPLLDRPVGKILRIDRNGQPLPDNPFVDRTGADPRVYAYGLRNPFGVSVDPVTGQALITENRETAGDAVYELVPGADYGWPARQIALRTALVLYDRSMGAAGITAYESDVLPAFTGDVFFCTFHVGGALHWLKTGELTAFDIAQRDRVIAPGCTSGVSVGTDGFIYFLDVTQGRLLRIRR